MHNDHGLNVESRRLKDVDDEHWDPSAFTDNGLRCREGVDVCMFCVCTCMFVRENNNDGAEVHQHPILYLLIYNYLAISNRGPARLPAYTEKNYLVTMDREMRSV